MLNYFVLPSVADVLASTSEWFNPLFDEFSIFAYIGLAIGLLGLIIRWVGGSFGHK